MVTNRLAASVAARIFFLFFAGVIGHSTASGATIEAAADRTSVHVNESFQIVFTAREEPDGDPDFAVLEKDFEILGRTHSSNIALINGEFTSTMTWTLTVMAKRAGRLTVPVVPFGRDRSRPLAVFVQGTQPATADAAGGEELFLEVSAEPKNPLVQSQVVYTLRLYRRVDIVQASLADPEVTDAVIEKLGDDSNYTADYGGEAYRVTERKYAIFPQKSGTVTIPPLELTAQVVVSRGRDPRFGGLFGRQATRTRRILSEAVTLDVRPVPATYAGTHWLPAEEVVLTENWSEDSGRLVVGEPVTRTVSLMVKGATVGQLPELDIGAEPGATGGGELKRYPDQPRLQEEKRKDGLVAVREEKVALIPSSPGRYMLPAIEIPWWNTRTGRMEVAKLPERTLQAVYGAGKRPSGPATQPALPVPDVSEQPKALASKSEPSAASPFHWIILSAFLALGWSGTALAWWWHSRRRGDRETADGKPAVSRRQALRALKEACIAGDPAGARTALLRWAAVRWPETLPVNLAAVAERCGEAMREEIRLLDRALYGAASAQWRGDSLWSAVRGEDGRRLVSSESGGRRELEALHRI